MALRLLQTNAAGAFWFNFHAGDLGHTLIIGPSGGGKTVLQNFLMSQLEKHDVTQIFIDKDRGAEIFVRACEGTYLPLKNGQPTGFRALAGRNEAGRRPFPQRFHPDADPRSEPALQRSTTRAASRKVSSRCCASRPPIARWTSCARCSVTRDPNGIGARLEKWCANGPLGWVFDNEADTLKFDSRFMGFDMTDFLDNPEIRTPLMMYLFHRIDALLDGRRVVVDIDEFWKALEDDAFKAFAQDGLKTYRKRNAFMVFGTQSPADALRSNIAHSIIEQTATKILLPNPFAREEEYRDGLGLSAVEFKLIKHELTPESRAFLIKQGNTSVVARLDLRGLDDDLAVLSGREQTLRVLEKVMAEHGPDVSAWLPAFQREARFA